MLKLTQNLISNLAIRYMLWKEQHLTYKEIVDAIGNPIMFLLSAMLVLSLVVYFLT